MALVYREFSTARELVQLHPGPVMPTVSHGYYASVGTRATELQSSPQSRFPSHDYVVVVVVGLTH
jgi:hypothetical protein